MKRIFFLLIPLYLIMSTGLPLSLLAQTIKPIAVRDSVTTLNEIPILIKPLVNDSSPSGGSLKLGFVSSSGHGKITNRTDSSFVYTSSYFFEGYDSVMYMCKDQQNITSNASAIIIHLLHNPSLPVANPDSATITAADSIIINITRNDVDPLNDPIEIDPYSQLYSPHKSVLKRLTDSTILYRSNSQFVGIDKIVYQVRRQTDTMYTSNQSYVKMNVTHNPLIPIAVNDTVDYLSFGTIEVDLLKNDYIPTEDSLKISLGYAQPPNMIIQPNLTILYHDSVLNSNQTHLFNYQILRKHDKFYSSNMAQLYVRYLNNPAYFYARPDTFTVKAYDTLIANIVDNDNPSSTQNKLYIESIDYSSKGKVKWSNQIFKYIPNIEFGDSEKLIYTLRDSLHPTINSEAPIFITITNRNTAYLDANHVKARFNARGNQFGPINGQGFEVPKGSGKYSIYSHIPWIGGLDEEDSLHFAGGKYGQGPYIAGAWTQWDYYVGPVMASTFYSDSQDSIWNRVWKVTKEQVDFHRFHYSDPDYQVLETILHWPGNGNPFLGQSEQLAPYYDVNKNGIYEPMQGDYPAIRGDQAIFFIFNDDRGYHTETQGGKLGIEVHGLAYAYNLMQDSAFDNTVFINYTFINKSQTTYNNTLFGFFTDVDLGYAQDDFVQCDVERNLFITYNADTIDGNGGGDQYAKHPPAQGVLLLGGPRMDADGIDNPKVDEQGNQLCNESVNGLYFGDSIVDNERLGIKRFFTLTNQEGIGMQWQFGWSYDQYYRFLNGFLPNETRWMYGGNGRIETAAYGPWCNYFYPGLSDTTDWGTGCVPPNGPKNWTEEMVGNYAGDRTGTIITGPITFHPGDQVEFDVAFPWARDYHSIDPRGSVEKLRIVADTLINAFKRNRLPNGEAIYAIEDKGEKEAWKIRAYPNPATNFVRLACDNKTAKEGTIEIFNLQGERLNSTSFVNLNGFVLPVDHLASGFYLLRITSANSSTTLKLVVTR